MVVPHGGTMAPEKYDEGIHPVTVTDHYMASLVDEVRGLRQDIASSGERLVSAIQALHPPSPSQPQPVRVKEPRR